MALALALSLLLLLGLRGALHAQDAGAYTVQPGDTLSIIAARFNVSLDSLIAANGISDPNLLQVGQTLLIPGVSIQPDLTSVATAAVPARPGDTLASVAARYGQDPTLVSSLNALTTTARLFPGRPVLLPQAAAPPNPLRFGAVGAVNLPSTLPQGRTGRLEVLTSRPLSVTATWNGLPLPLAPLDAATRLVALVPVPALLATGPYPMVLNYTTRAGIPVTTTLSVEVVDGGYERQVISVPADRTDLLEPTRVQNEYAKASAAWSGFTTDLVPRVPFTRPIGVEFPTTSPYGTRRYYDSGPNSYEGYHAGQDFSAGVGISVTAPAAGFITLAEPLEVRGNAVIMDHGRGVYSGFWHLSQILVQPGQYVNQGDVIGAVGNTGLSTGAHLHWELIVTGIAVDPMQFLDESPYPP